MEIIEKEVGKHKEYASKGVGNAGLTLGIIGTALAALGGGNGFGGLFGGASAKENEDYVTVTREYYEGRIEAMKNLYAANSNLTNELFSQYKGTRDGYDSLNSKIVDSSFALYKNQRDQKDELLSRIQALETKQAVSDAVEPWRAKVLEMQIGGVAASSQAAMAIEAERRAFADNTIVNYANSTFYPVSVANVTVGATATAKSTSNPLVGALLPIVPPIV
jgi:hypothetical protein